jgi:hypothetical protein
VAHCALKNFVTGLVVFAILAGVHHVSEPRTDELVTRLRADKSLRELIRGPQGPSGATGVRGPTGTTGTQGPPGVTSVTGSSAPSAPSKRATSEPSP